VYCRNFFIGHALNYAPPTGGVFTPHVALFIWRALCPRTPENPLVAVPSASHSVYHVIATRVMTRQSPCFWLHLHNFNQNLLEYDLPLHHLAQGEMLPKEIWMDEIWLFCTFRRVLALFAVS